ncbi:zf-HC2 domain-containing protein [Rhizobium sp. PDO1-076]
MLDCRHSCPHQEEWALIPWYVNGSLPPEEAEVVRRHVLICAECAIEVLRQQRLSKHVVTDTVFDTSLAPSWDVLSAGFRVERNRITSQLGDWHWLWGNWGPFARRRNCRRMHRCSR